MFLYQYDYQMRFIQRIESCLELNQFDVDRSGYITKEVR